MASKNTTTQSKIQLFVLNTNNYQQLDLFPTEPIKITLSAYDVSEGGGNKSDYTQKFRLPHTPANASFFKNVYSVNGRSFNATQISQAYITMQGQVFRFGTIHLQNIILNYKDRLIRFGYEIIEQLEAYNAKSVSKLSKDVIVFKVVI